MNMQTVDLIPALEGTFDKCEIVNDSIARCEHRFNGKLRSVFFVRATNSVPDPEEVANIQRSVVAPSYFASRDESRWNHYLVFVVPSSVAPHEAQRRSLIERDTSYARKLVIPYAELGSFLRRGVSGELDGASNANALQQAWSDALRDSGLGAVDSDEPRSSVLRAIKAGSRTTSGRAQRSVVDNQPLAFLSQLRIGQFGVRSLKGEFTFGRVNLIRGVNGAGKTSLLEAIEHFLCGATARGKAAEKFIASATFTNSEREIHFQQRPASYYQQRDLKWYGRKTTQRNRLYEGFARYNFLSADAAVDFSREEDQHDLTTVLSRVALGPEAGFTWDRIQQVHGDIGPQLGILQREITTLGSHLERVNARLSALTLPAPETSSRSAHIAGLLSKIGWEMSPEALATPEGFQKIVGLRLLLDSVPDDIPGTLQDVQGEMHQNEVALESIRTMEAAKRANESRRAELDSSLKANESLGRCVARLEEYVQVRFAELVTRIAEANRDESVPLPSRETMARLLVEVERAELAKAGSTASLADTAQALKAEIAALRRAIDEASAIFEAASSRLKERRVLVAQLRSVGLKLAQEHPDDGCPLCSTRMSAASLIDRIQGAVVDEDSAQLAAIDDSRGSLVARMSSLLDTQGLIDSIAQSFPDITRVPFQSVMLRIDEADADKARKVVERSELHAAMSHLQAHGFGQKEFLGLLARCEAEISSEFSAPTISPDLMQIALRHVDTRRSALTRELSQHIEKEAELAAALNEQAISVTGDADIVAAKFAAAKRAASLRTFISTFADLPRQVRERANDDLRTFLDAAVVTYTQVTALSEELRASHAKNLEIASLRGEANSLTQALTKLSSERENLKAALGVLDRIINEHSLEKGLTDFLSSNLLSIQSIFRRIHVPNELRLSNLSGCEIVRTVDGSPTSLSQISTGQRAALVLSVFLTLNMSLRSGPPMMLVDDPIAHVDDMNSLALLDYLADIAETGRRQIFFATADEKLANLFEKKMAFLERDFQVIPLERYLADGETSH